jgi:hypothetical protein
MLVSLTISSATAISKRERNLKILVYDPPLPLDGLVYVQQPFLSPAEKKDYDRLVSYLSEEVRPYSSFILNKCQVTDFTAASDFTAESTLERFSFATVSNLRSDQLNCIMAQASGDVRVSFRDN